MMSVGVMSVRVGGDECEGSEYGGGDECEGWGVMSVRTVSMGVMSVRVVGDECEGGG